ncbi:MAG: SPOR domain-containing protein [Pseudomonadota bacterium]
MAFFKFRKGGDEHATPAPAPQSVEAMRTRARHRLIGASVLVLLGVIGFPMLFDSQPRPISVDIPIEIPDKNTVKPLATTSTAQAKPAADIVVESDAGKEHVSVASAPSARPAVAPSRASTGTVSVAASAPPKPITKPDAKPAEKPVEKPVAKPADKPVDKPPARADDGAKAQALLEGKDTAQKAASSPAAAAAGRFIVQIGAFSDGVKAHEARVKLEKAGMKTYTQVVEPKEGKRIRVRVGPFESKGEADKTADKIRKLDLPASVLEL